MDDIRPVTTNHRVPQSTVHLDCLTQPSSSQTPPYHSRREISPFSAEAARPRPRRRASKSSVDSSRSASPAALSRVGQGLEPGRDSPASLPQPHRPSPPVRQCPRPRTNLVWGPQFYSFNLVLHRHRCRPHPGKPFGGQVRPHPRRRRDEVSTPGQRPSSLEAQTHIC